MNIDDFSMVMQDNCNDDVVGLITISLKKDGTFWISKYGELTYLEAVGMLASATQTISLDGMDMFKS